MVNATRCRLALALAACVLAAAAALRGGEYDEQYTLFLIGGVSRPVWPETAFRADLVETFEAGPVDLARIAWDLRAADVHPPLYFWLAALWKSILGDGLFALRLLSVACSLATLAMVAALARLARTPPALAVMLTLGCYGFAYTGVIARGFALAQLLVVAGTLVLLRSRGAGAHAAAGALFGAATMTNYLALFPAVGVLAGWTWRAMAAEQVDGEPGPRPRPASPAWIIPGMLPFLAIDAWFFLAQRTARPEQFPPFELVPGLIRLARYAASALLGGLPLYVGAAARPAVSAVLGLMVIGLALVIWRRHAIRSCPILMLACGGPPVGLLVLGLVFDNTPIELRYLAFSTPFAAVLIAGAIGALPALARRAVMVLLLGVQAAALTGMALRPETMQPARMTARAAAALTGDGVVLLPRGNDGVGIVGAFAHEAPPSLMLLVVAPADSPAAIQARLIGRNRAVVAMLAQDQDSRLSILVMLAALSGSGWHLVAEGFNVAAFERDAT